MRANELNCIPVSLTTPTKFPAKLFLNCWLNKWYTSTIKLHFHHVSTGNPNCGPDWWLYVLASPDFLNFRIQNFVLQWRVVKPQLQKFCGKRDSSLLMLTRLGTMCTFLRLKVANMQRCEVHCSIDYSLLQVQSGLQVFPRRDCCIWGCYYWRRRRD